MLIRKPAVADFFYPANPEILTKSVRFFIDQGKAVPVSGKLNAVVVPHAGYVYSGIVAGASYKLLDQLAKDKNWQVILLGPSHRYPLRGVSVCAYDYLETPLGKIKVAEQAKQMAKDLGFIPQADAQEHSLEVQFPFLQLTLKNFEVIPIVLGQVNVRALANYLEQFITENTILVISTDLSHYFPYEKAVAVDGICNKAIPAIDLDLMSKSGDACGITGVLTSMLIAKSKGWQGTFLDYKNSGDTAGPKDRVVGYGAYAFSKN